MIKPRMTVEEKPDPSLRDAILGPLADYNSSKTGAARAQPVAILLRHPERNDVIGGPVIGGPVIGGLWGMIYADWLFVELLFVPEESRGQDQGTALMKEAEAIARRHGCVGVRLDTFTFQAPGFYEKLGYKEYGRLHDHPRGHERIYYFKTLLHN